jgi:hypothetical protein
MPAEPKLLEYAYRVRQDVPFEADIVKFDNMKAEVDTGNNAGVVTILSGDTNLSSVKDELQLKYTEKTDLQGNDVSEKCLTSSYEQVLNIFGRFKQEAIELGLSELR